MDNEAKLREALEKLTALRNMVEACSQPLYVEIIDEVLAALARPPQPAPSVTEVTEAMVEAACAAKHDHLPSEWTDGLTPGIAQIERMMAEKMLEAALAARPDQPACICGWIFAAEAEHKPDCPAAPDQPAHDAEVERLCGRVEDAYLEGYAQGMTAGSLMNREDDWLASKARAALTNEQERPER
jgi:hypothetical protein